MLNLDAEELICSLPHLKDIYLNGNLYECTELQMNLEILHAHNIKLHFGVIRSVGDSMVSFQNMNFTCASKLLHKNCTVEFEPHLIPRYAQDYYVTNTCKLFLQVSKMLYNKNSHT